MRQDAVENWAPERRRQVRAGTFLIASGTWRQRNGSSVCWDVLPTIRTKFSSQREHRARAAWDYPAAQVALIVRSPRSQPALKR